MLRHREFDVAEMSLSSYVLSLFQPEPPFIADSRVSVARVSSFGDLRQRAQRHHRAEGSDRKESRAARVSVDRQRLDSRHPRGTLRRPGGERQLLHRRTGNTGPRREAEAAAPAAVSRRADCAGSRRWQPCSRTATSTRFTARGRRRRSTAQPGAVKRLFQDFKTVEQEYFRQTADFPHHAHRRDPA